MNDLGLADNKSISDETANVLPRVGVGDFVDLVVVEPDITLLDVQITGNNTNIKLKQLRTYINKIIKINNFSTTRLISHQPYFTIVTQVKYIKLLMYTNWKYSKKLSTYNFQFI